MGVRRLLGPSRHWHLSRALILCFSLYPFALCAAATKPAACTNQDFKVAIDVGHTPQAPGATSARGRTEYSFNLTLANQISETLRDGGFRNVSLIMESGVGTPQLLLRTRQASLLGADLFISIHHDAVQSLYLQKWIFEGQQHFFSDKFSGYSLFVSRRNSRFAESLIFAGFLGSALESRGFRYSAHHAEPIAGENRQLIDSKLGIYVFDDLLVLKFSKSPAVLLEAGIIVNRQDELASSSSETTAKISNAVLDAVIRFCSRADGEQPHN